MSDIVNGVWYSHIEPLNAILVDVHHRAGPGIRGTGKIDNHVAALGPLDLKADLGVIIVFGNQSPETNTVDPPGFQLPSPNRLASPFLTTGAMLRLIIHSGPKASGFST